jgi:hypothetical protein
MMSMFIHVWRNKWYSLLGVCYILCTSWGKFCCFWVVMLFSHSSGIGAIIMISVLMMVLALLFVTF